MEAVLKTKATSDLDITEVSSKLLEYEKKCMNGTIKYYTLDEMNKAIDKVVDK